jgi:hypothetical protein
MDIVDTGTPGTSGKLFFREPSFPAYRILSDIEEQGYLPFVQDSKKGARGMLLISYGEETTGPQSVHTISR